MPLAKRFTPPKVFDEYRLVRQLGQGAMGQVYLGHDTLLDRPVAIKFISALEPDALARERFLIEARAIARLSHPNVVAVYRVSQIGTWPYLVYEYLRGESMEKLPRPVPWERALEIGLGIAAGLGAAHRRGVLHRDVKPANVMLTEAGEIKLLDFGLAKLSDALPRPTLEPPAEPPAEDVGLAGTLSESAASLAASPAPARPPSDPSGPPPDLVATASFASGEDPGVPTGRGGSSSGGSSGASLTSAGTLLGTPRYMAPEAWRGEPATSRTDVYSLGSILFELCAGRPPFRETTMQELRDAVLSRPAPPLREAAPDVDERFAAAVDRCLAADPQARPADGGELHHLLEQLRPGGRTDLPEGNPYRGLGAFEAEHRALFFGRSDEIRDVLELLRQEPVVVVAGDSGVGKSSLCRAGVLPYVEEGALGDGRRWGVTRLVPGRRPLQALCEALLPHVHGGHAPPGRGGMSEDELLRLLRTDPPALWRALRRRLGDERGLVLLFDQGEELVTQAEAEESALCAEALSALAARVPGLRALVTVRGDFLTRFMALPGLRLGLARALYLVRPLSLADLREAIVGPARAKGVRFESEDLVETLARSTARAQGGLPLLQFALAELWDQRDEERRLIPASALERIGGVEGALSRHADGVLAVLSPAQRRSARRILTRLVTPEGTRARRGDEELVGGEALDGEDDAGRRALEALVRGRLLFAQKNLDGPGSIYEVAHESLVQGWGTLRGWLDENADRRAIVARVEAAAAEWERLYRSRDALWGDRLLAEAAGLDPEDLSPREAAFVAQSRRAASSRRWRRRLLLAGAPLTLALVYGGFSLKASYQLDRTVGRHVAGAREALGRAHAEDREARALRERAFALFDRADGPDSAAAEAAWDAARERAEAAAAAYTRASRELETALLLDNQRRPVRQLLGEVLYQRLLLAERDRQPAQVDELRQRLANYDEDGALRRRLEAPARVRLDTAPAGAEVRLVRIDRTAGRARAEAPQPIGRTPISAHLPPGSYVLLLSAPGRPVVRYPLLLGRGEQLDLRVPLPADVPAGYVYIPPGRFLFGNADSDTLRRSLLAAQPLHEVRTGAYLIGRHEVTFEQWIEFLRALPEAERQRRRPSVSNQHGAGTVYGAVNLEELSGGAFRLMLQPTTRPYVAVSGEPLEYAQRQQRRRPDWRRFPVVGVTYADAEAYGAWLDRSGRLPGARLCDEHEWERAARGADDRLYPHGDRLQGDEANIDETYGRRPLAYGPDEVGAHPASDSPFGVADLAGNVWEWTRPRDRDSLLCRGGGWYQDRFSARSDNRQLAEASMRTVDVGIRICAPAPPG